MTARDIAEALGGRKSGGGWVARCPAHDDRSPSLSIGERDGTILVKCHAGCEQRDVIAGLRDRGLWPDPAASGHNNDGDGPIVAEYFYRDEDGNILFRVTRHIPKTFRQWRPDGHGGWRKGIRGIRRVLYRLPEVIESPIVFVVEGERDVETLREWGFCATCNPGGAGKWRQEYAEHLRGRTLIIIPDTDPVGRQHARDVIVSCRSVAPQIIIVDLGDDAVKDISAWLEAGHSEVELLATIDAAWQEVPHGES